MIPHLLIIIVFLGCHGFMHQLFLLAIQQQQQQ